jgi:hypothetical protein
VTEFAKMVFSRPESTLVVSIDGKKPPPCSTCSHCGGYSPKSLVDIKYPIRIYPVVDLCRLNSFAENLSSVGVLC